MTVGNLYIVSAASGTGKTSLLNVLLQKEDNIVVSISHTTRQKREGEENGKHYHFVDAAQFEALIEQGDFLEHAKVFGNYYGTSQSSVQKGLGVVVVLGLLAIILTAILPHDWVQGGFALCVGRLQRSLRP